MAISTAMFGGVVDEVAAALSWGAASYWVESPGAWAPTVLSTADRTVTVAAGAGHARTLRTVIDTPTNVQFDSQATGSRWDLLVMRHTYTPPGGTSALVKIKGSGTGTPQQQQVALIAGKNTLVSTDSRVDDQPIALVQITAGSQTPTAIVDLRSWYANGGMTAADELALQFLGDLGTDVTIGSTSWRRIRDASGQPVWRSDAESAPFALRGDLWGVRPGYASSLTRRGGRWLLSLSMRNLGAGTFTGGANPVGTIPTQARVANAPAVIVSGATFGPLAKGAEVTVNPGTGEVSFWNPASFSAGVGDFGLSFQAAWDA